MRYHSKDIIVDTIMSNNQTKFIYFSKKDNSFSIKSKVDIDEETYFPISTTSSFISNWSLLLPTMLTDYWTEQDLLKSINSFIKKYVDIPQNFRIICTYYILLTYVYDNFSELPYLRVIWDYGSWKSRLLKTIGSICFIPMITNWGSSISAIFRMIDKFNWTLVIDEADISHSDTSNEMIKIYNNWYQKWYSIMRADWEGFEPKCYNVFWPKIIWWRMEFKDKATESRCLSHIMKKSKRTDIPICLDENFYKEAQELRNKLYRYRYDNFF